MTTSKEKTWALKNAEEALGQNPGLYGGKNTFVIGALYAIWKKLGDIELVLAGK